MANIDKKEVSVINFDEMADVSYEMPKFHEEIRRGENGEIVAYVLKRNKNTKDLKQE